MSGKILCLAPASLRSSLQDTFTSFLGPKWEASKSLEVTWLSERACKDIPHCARLIKLGAERAPAEIWLIGHIFHDAVELSEDSCVIRPIKDVKRLRSTIKSLLDRHKLGLAFEYSAYFTERWETTTNITPEHIKEWLGQFNKLGNFEWVGRGVLASVECFSTEELVRLLGLSDSDQVRYFSPPADPVGSSSPLGNAVVKKHNALSVERFDLAELLEQQARVILVEDCAISGREFERFANRHWPDESPSEDHKLVSITLKYSLLADIAKRRIEKIIELKDLHNVKLDYSHSHQLELLTRAGAKAISNEDFYSKVDGSCLNLGRYVRQAIFDVPGTWGDQKKAVTAKRILRHIGEQLYREDYARRNDGQQGHGCQWFRQAGLGAGGLALAIALARSIPKSTLPVIWARGTVEYNGASFEWQPLLPH